MRTWSSHFCWSWLQSSRKYKIFSCFCFFFQELQRALSIKEAALTEKDDQLQQLHAKLHQLSTDSEKERKQLQTVMAKMEKHLTTTTEELNQERSVGVLGQI